MVTSIFNGQVVRKQALVCHELRRCRWRIILSGNFQAASKPQCQALLSTAPLAHAAPLYGRPQAFRALHPPGPLATHTGSAQVTGLLKERSQDYYLAATEVAFDGGYYCSQTSWSDCDDGYKGVGHVSGNLISYGGTAGCSTTDSGTGIVSSPSAVDAPSIVVTGVFDGHGGEMSARYAQQAILSYVANDRELHSSLGNGDVESVTEVLRGIFRRVDSELLSLAAGSAAADPLPGASSPPQPVLLAGGDFHDGTTALVTLQLGGLLAVANAGDSRAVLCRRGEAVRLSRDHTPALRAERERIEAAGGQVVVARGAARVVVPLAGRKDVMQVGGSGGSGDVSLHFTLVVVSRVFSNGTRTSLLCPSPKALNGRFILSPIPRPLPLPAHATCTCTYTYTYTHRHSPCRDLWGTRISRPAVF
ncbi:hypothetical protein Vafri_17340 [Volvox africanus]|uniref:PPM-type phosphatase domain-containing protein n=1 Tax=Volvox africanus TaxID=51714 RepID=A0A8J4BLR1_9CHLO|nr:hypothetical protein Vafri_17340 [Volvox africanus]